MRVNIYAEEISELVEIVRKRDEQGNMHSGVRFYTQLPVTIPFPGSLPCNTNVKGPFMHKRGDDDSAAVTFWSLSEAKRIFMKALQKIDRELEKRSS